jgi:acyl carrier protein
MDLRDEVIQKLVERLTIVIGAGKYAEGTTFEALNLKSVNYSQTIAALEDDFDIEIPFMDFKRKKTIGESADYIVNLVEG